MADAGRLAQRRILDTGFGAGSAFLAAWCAWKDDPQRPRILHFVALTDRPASAADLLRAAQPNPAFHCLAQTLASGWDGLLPGVHRLVFEAGHVLLTLCIGDTERMLRQLDFHADAVTLRGNLAPIHLKALARCCRRGTTIDVLEPDGALRVGLKRHGFVLDQSGAGCLRGEFAPAWEPRGPLPKEPVVPGHCLVVGAGLAGAAVAASMARRGWAVVVLEAAATPASGASGLPAGVLVPHTSPDDNQLSRLSRDGIRATLQQAQELLTPGEDFAACGVLEHRLDASAAQPVAADATAGWNRPATRTQKQLAGLEPDARADWHAKAAWIRPARLVAAWLAQPGIELRCGAPVAQLQRAASGWRAFSPAGDMVASGDLVIVAAAVASQALVQGLALQAVRGQVTWALQGAPAQGPPFPVNGDGSFIPSVPTPHGLAWMCGSSYDRGDTDLLPRAADQHANLARLRRLLPKVAQQVEAATPPSELRSWVGIRCAAIDRRPLVGPLLEAAPDGPWLSTAMGSRGLTFAALAGELIAARIHGEPLPLARKLAQALAPARLGLRAAGRALAANKLIHITRERNNRLIP